MVWIQREIARLAVAMHDALGSRRRESLVIVRSISAVRDLSAALATSYLGTTVEIWACGIPESGMLVQPVA
jgi:hypothetical protein